MLLCAAPGCRAKGPILPGKTPRARTGAFRHQGAVCAERARWRATLIMHAKQYYDVAIS